MRKTLAEIAMKSVSTSGLESISLRKIAKQAECSTAVIFQNFDSKTGLLLAAAELAQKKEAEHHRHLLEKIDGLISCHLAFSDFLAAYIDLRVSRPEARFLSEVLIKLSGNEIFRPTLQRWHTDRGAFWQAVLGSFEFGDAVGPLISEYCLMEEIYAYSLNGNPRYQLFQKDTVRALTDACFHHGATSGASNEINRVLAWRAYETRRQLEVSRPKMPTEMLDHAVDMITHGGIGALNQRSLAQRAGVSPSMIAYHFNDMKSFTNEAIWQALVKDLPGEFDPDKIVKLPKTLPDWVDFLYNTLLTVPADANSGFYVSYSRMTGEAALLACADKSLEPLILYLREIDGWGTYRLSRNIASIARSSRHEHAAAFAVWVKAEALLHHSGLVNPACGRERVGTAMSLIFPQADSSLETP
ncbi:MAG: TetR family transcriptional regulator [Caenibius sp.]